MGLYKLIREIWKKYSNKPGICGCGIAGQRLKRNASIFGNNIENSDPGRFAGRGGLGAILGSKRIIAIMTDDTEGESPIPKNKNRFLIGCKKLVNCLNMQTGIQTKRQPTASSEYT